MDLFSGKTPLHPYGATEESGNANKKGSNTEYGGSSARGGGPGNDQGSNGDQDKTKSDEKDKGGEGSKPSTEDGDEPHEHCDLDELDRAMYSRLSRMDNGQQHMSMQFTVETSLATGDVSRELILAMEEAGPQTRANVHGALDALERTLGLVTDYHTLRGLSDNFGAHGTHGQIQSGLEEVQKFVEDEQLMDQSILTSAPLYLRNGPDLPTKEKWEAVDGHVSQVQGALLYAREDAMVMMQAIKVNDPLPVPEEPSSDTELEGDIKETMAEVTLAVLTSVVGLDGGAIFRISTETPKPEMATLKWECGPLCARHTAATAPGGRAQDQESFSAAFTDGSRIVVDEIPVNCVECRDALSAQQVKNIKTSAMRQGRTKRTLTVNVGRFCTLGDVFQDPHGASRAPANMRLMQLYQSGHYTTLQQAVHESHTAEEVDEGPSEGLLSRIQTPVVGRDRPAARGIYDPCPQQ